MELDKRWIALAVVILLVAFAGGIKYSNYKSDRQVEKDALFQSLEEMDEAEGQEAEESYPGICYRCCKNPGYIDYRKTTAYTRRWRWQERWTKLTLNTWKWLSLVDGETIWCPPRRSSKLPASVNASGAYMVALHLKARLWLIIRLCSRNGRQVGRYRPNSGQRIVITVLQTVL